MNLIVAKELLADKQFPIRTRLVLAQLLDHRNPRTGQCNPKQRTLALELGVGLRTVTRAIARLREAGIICGKQGQHTGFYEIQVSQNGRPQVSQNGRPGRAHPYMKLSKVERISGGVDSIPCNGSVPAVENPPAPPPPVIKPKRTRTHAPVVRKPPIMAESTVSIVRASLEDLAPRVHLPPPDEDLVRRVVDAARGAPGENIHASLVALFKRGRFGTMRSWGLVPVLIDACFQPPDRAAVR